MRLSSRFLLAVFVALPVLAVAAGCIFGPEQHVVWICLNPTTGHEDNAPYDSNHYVNGVFDPCHCYDPCGPLKSCPSDIDAGPLPAGCDAGVGSDAGGDAGGW